MQMSHLDFEQQHHVLIGHMPFEEMLNRLLQQVFSFLLKAQQQKLQNVALRAGLPLYVEPTLDWAPFPYGPGQPAVAAALGVLGLDGLLAARLSSWLGALLLLVGCAGLASSLAGPPGGGDGRSLGLTALGLTAAGWVSSGYVATGAWLDVARPDALALGLAATGLWGAIRSCGRARLVILAVMGALAVHTKQTVLLPLACAALGLGGVPLAAGLGAAVLVGYGLGELVTGPWYRFHTLELLAGHGLTGEGIRSLATHDLPRLLPLLAAAGLGAVASRHRSEPGPTRANQRALVGWALGVGRVSKSNERFVIRDLMT